MRLEWSLKVCRAVRRWDVGVEIMVVGFFEMVAIEFFV